MVTAAKKVYLKLFKYYYKAISLYNIILALDLYINIYYFKCEKQSKKLIDDQKYKMENIWKRDYKPSNIIDISISKISDDDFLSSIYEKKQYIDINDELKQ